MRKIFLVIVGICIFIGLLVLFDLVPNAFNSVLLFFLLPTVLLMKPEHIFVRPIYFSIIVATSAIIMIDTIAHMSHQWNIPHSILSSKLFWYVTIEVIFWAVLNFFLVTFLWENYFLQSKSHKIIPCNLYKLVAFLFIIILFSIFLRYKQYWDQMKYFYAWYGTVLIVLPACIYLFRRPHFRSKLIMLAGLHALLTGVYEIIALRVGWWSFPGRYLMAYDFFWHTLPLEEVICWLVFFPVAIISYYDFFYKQELVS